MTRGESSASGGLGDPGLWHELETTLADRVRRRERVAGGDLGLSHRVELASGRTLFVKQYSTNDLPSDEHESDPTPSAAQAEAAALRWLAEPEVLRIAQPVMARRDWIALEWIESGAPADDFEHQLGHGLAHLHASGAPRFGLDHDNWIGPLRQSNADEADWATFYARRRLTPLFERAKGDRLLSDTLLPRFEQLIERMPELVGPPEAPSRLHGDLWSGNVLADADGAPCLIDPAAYGGHREIDLAMLSLFGGFGPALFHAYDEVLPLASGADARVPLYQTYPLLVHVCLFGRSYEASLARAVDAALEIVP